MLGMAKSASCRSGCRHAFRSLSLCPTGSDPSCNWPLVFTLSRCHCFLLISRLPIDLACLSVRVGDSRAPRDTGLCTRHCISESFGPTTSATICTIVCSLEKNGQKLSPAVCSSSPGQGSCVRCGGSCIILHRVPGWHWSSSSGSRSQRRRTSVTSNYRQSHV